MSDAAGPRIVAGTANPALAETVAAALGGVLVGCEVERFPDGELRPVVDAVRGGDVYVLQPTAPPVGEHLVELLLLVDACRRAGASRVTAVVPYFGYARQDRRGRPGEAVGARVACDAIAAAGADRMVVVDPHTAALEAMCSIPLEALTAVPVLADHLAAAAAGGAVLVAPDLGAVKLAERYASILNLPVSVVRKTRLTGTAVRAEELVGDVEGLRAIVVDDMISTGGTIAAAARVLSTRGARPGLVVVATHGLFVGSAAERLQRLGVDRLLVTDTVLPTAGPTVEVCPIGPLLADAIGRLHRDECLDDLLPRG
jgi:ribose-phosphate pyrophosphokinase